MQLSRQEKNKLFSYANDVSEICRILFKTTPIRYFDYHCFYHDGHSVSLSTQPEFTEYFITESLYPKLMQNQMVIQLSGHWVFLSDMMPLPADKNHKEIFIKLYTRSTQLNLFHFTAFIRKFHDRFLISSFGINQNNASIFEFYLNHLDKLELFVNSFENKAQHLIYGTDRNLIWLPNYNKNQNLTNPTHNHIPTIFPLEDISIDGNRTIISNSNTLTLSQRQLDCLTHHTMGYSAKMSAEKFNISPRTVERHLELAKEKIGYPSKRTLRTILQKNGILL